MGIPPFFSVIQGLAFWYVFVSLTEKDGKRWEKVLHFLKSIQYPVLLFFFGIHSQPKVWLFRDVFFSQ